MSTIFCQQVGFYNVLPRVFLRQKSEYLLSAAQQIAYCEQIKLNRKLIFAEAFDWKKGGKVCKVLPIFLILSFF